MKWITWITRIFAVIGLIYSGLMVAGTLGIGYSLFYYGNEPISVIINEDGAKYLVISAPSHNQSDGLNDPLNKDF